MTMARRLGLATAVFLACVVAITAHAQPPPTVTLHVAVYWTDEEHNYWDYDKADFGVRVGTVSGPYDCRPGN